MSYKEIYELSNELYAERLELVEERIEQIIRESAIEPAFADYFRSAAKCINTIKNHSADKEFNDLFYSQFDKENYEKSYANPAYAVKVLGDEYGQLLSAVYAKIAGSITHIYQGDIKYLCIYAELIVELYNYFENANELSPDEIRGCIYSFMHDYEEIFAEDDNRALLDPAYDYYTELVNEADLSNDDYLYSYGLYVGENERAGRAHLASFSDEEIQAMADTYTVNKQFDYDHKEDMALWLDKAYVEYRLECMHNALERMKDVACKCGGPAVIEIFGEEPFAPVSKKEAAHFNDEQQKLVVHMTSVRSQYMNSYIHSEDRSFTIIAYPCAAIGPDYKEIFTETVKINTLDYALYRDMQQKIIDVLDTADRVHIVGTNGNRTDLYVKIHELKEPSKETAFENCVADVNIPVGEVFTSPVLEGTNGKLHVSQVYLNELNFLNLEIDFKDGMIDKYTCTNFEDEEENRKYISDNVLFHHDTLPMGEFAIGTNTTAYRMARVYDIAAKMPILIAEKTGPHFAVGDTCYTYDEDNMTYNPDGKAIIARDNSVSIRRKEDISKAYFNCHTDITIPYDELGAITVIRHDGSTCDIIKDGRFVLEGVEELNKPLDTLDAESK